MKKLSLVALLSVLTIGALVGCGNKNSSETPTPSSSETPVSSEPVSSEPVSSEDPVETGELPAPWGENPTYANNECSVTLVPGSIAGQAEDVRAVSEFFGVKGIRYIDLRDESEGYHQHVEGFESISYNKVVCGAGEQLYVKNDDGTFTARYEDSEVYLNAMFPKDTVLFVMCQGGVRVQPFLQLLEQEGYDMSKVYNVGGMNQVLNAKDPKYGGYQISNGIKASSITYDFSALKGE